MKTSMIRLNQNEIRLLSAAPSMLSALLAAKMFIEAEFEINPPAAFQQQVLDQVNRAIAKAKGEGL